MELVRRWTRALDIEIDVNVVLLIDGVAVKMRLVQKVRILVLADWKALLVFGIYRTARVEDAHCRTNVPV